MADMLSYLGSPVTEDILFAMGVGLDFRFGLIIGEKMPRSRQRQRLKVCCVDTMANLCDWVHICRTYGVNLAQREFSALQEMQDCCREELRMARPVLISVDIYYLGYHPSVSKVHAGHTVVLCGMDLAAGTAWIADNHTATLASNTFAGTIPISDLMKAIDLRKTDSSLTAICWTMHPVADARPFLISEVPMQLQRSGAAILAGGKDGRLYRGGDAFRQLAEYLNDLAVAVPTQAWSEKLRGLHMSITGLGGPVPTRSLFARFLGRMYAEKAICLKPGLDESYARISQEWRILSTLLLKAASTDESECVRRAAGRLAAVTEEEERLARMLCEVSVDLRDDHIAATLACPD